jgi:hypothetical protein
LFLQEDAKMGRVRTLPLFIVLLGCILVGCGPGTASPTPAAATEPISIPETTTTTPTPLPGGAIIVTSAADSGPGTLRQALQSAQPGDAITFDPAVFPPDAPATISLDNCLPPIEQGYLTVDASDAGVILDGSGIGDEWCSGLTITSSWNTVQGLWFDGFMPGAGIELSGGAQHNLIGGDPGIGSGPLGQGNLVSHGGLGFNIVNVGTSYNTIMGNFIGTDRDGNDLGNSSNGFWIDGDAILNTIGPGNVIAYNDSCGCEIQDEDTTGNTITQNSIHDNAVSGIRLVGGEQPSGSTEPTAPVISDFDLAAGTVAGSACPNCVVEIFSDESDQGGIYEGRTVADSAGDFSLDRGAPFAGPHLTATATDPDGNTSSFSEPIFGLRRHVVLQIGNDLPWSELHPRPAVELDDNRLGEMYSLHCETVTSPSDWFDRTNELGLKWARVSVDWYDWPEVAATGEYSDYEIGDCERRAVELLHENGFRVLYTLVYWDPDIEVYPGYTRFRTEEEIDRFVDYVRYIVGNFRGTVDWYSLLNEPNAEDEGGGQRHVLVDDYITLARRVIPVIRELDPDAGIVVGEVTPLNECGSYDYLMTILQTDDIMAAVDGIAWHGSSGNSLEYQPDFYNNYPIWVSNIVETAHAHGFQGQFFSQELHWRTPETPQPIEGRPWFYSDTVSAKYYARGIVWHLGQGFIVGIGHEGYEQIPEVRRVVQDLTTLMAGAEPNDLTVSIESEAEPLQIVTFAVSDGSTLVAVWRDGTAVDDDPGIPATVTLPGFSAEEVTGIDVLYGFEQPLVFEDDGGSLVISDLLVRDYPIILRFR